MLTSLMGYTHPSGILLDRKPGFLYAQEGRKIVEAGINGTL